MKFGDTVLVLRGSVGRPANEEGCLRVVAARLVCRYRGTSTVQLLRDDPWAANQDLGQGNKGQRITFDSSRVFGARALALAARSKEIRDYTDMLKEQHAYGH